MIDEHHDPVILSKRTPLHLPSSFLALFHLKLDLNPLPTLVPWTVFFTDAHRYSLSRNSLTTVTRLKTGPFFSSSSQALPLCYTIMQEVVAVARAKGLTIPDDTVDKLIKQCTDVAFPGLPSSMMADNFAKRPMEVEVSFSESDGRVGSVGG